MNNALLGGKASVLIPLLRALVDKLKASHAPVCDTAALNLLHLEGEWERLLVHYGELANPLTCAHFPTRPRYMWTPVVGPPPPCFASHKR